MIFEITGQIKESTIGYVVFDKPLQYLVNTMHNGKAGNAKATRLAIFRSALCKYSNGTKVNLTFKQPENSNDLILISHQEMNT